MATRSVLAELADACQRATGVAVRLESVGGVEAARRVRSGEPFDAVILAADAVDDLLAAGCVRAGSRVDLVNSPVALAVRAGEPVPDIASEEALRRAVQAAARIGYSTGPSGTALLRQFERWGIAAAIAPRLLQAPAGVPVGTLVARGDVTLGFQQLSELIHVHGITVLGTLPAPVQIITTFAGAIGAASAQVEAARRLLAFLASPAAAKAKRCHGMEPA